MNFFLQPTLSLSQLQFEGVRNRVLDGARLCARLIEQSGRLDAIQDRLEGEMKLTSNPPPSPSGDDFNTVTTRWAQAVAVA